MINIRSALPHCIQMASVFVFVLVFVSTYLFVFLCVFIRPIHTLARVLLCWHCDMHLLHIDGQCWGGLYSKYGTIQDPTFLHTDESS